MNPPTIQAGPKLQAALRGKKITGENGILVSNTAAGVVVALAPFVDWLHPAIITQVNTGGASPDDPAWPSTVSYSVSLIGRRSAVDLTAMVPVNRTVVQDEVMIRPAAHESPCIVMEYRKNDKPAYALIAFEREAFGDCPQ